MMGNIFILYSNFRNVRIFLPLEVPPIDRTEKKFLDTTLKYVNKMSYFSNTVII